MAHRTCTLPDCGSTDYYAIGLCRTHYDKQRKTGYLAPLPVRYWPDANGCWIWRLSRDKQGYGQYPTGTRGRHKRAHRVVYERLRGPIPAGLELDHLCRVHACVNPDHLEPVTHAENMARGIQASQTHCKYGHEYTPENTYRNPSSGFRSCRICIRERSKVA